MALFNCKECGREISTEAVACPGCGANVGAPKVASSWMKKITHIECKECGESFSAQEKACPKCGAKVTMPLAGKIMAAVIVLILVSWVFSPSDEAKSSGTVQIEKPQLAPEMIVRPVHGQFLAACQSKELLKELLGHAAAQEKTKFAAMFGRLDCVQTPETETYKILSVSNGTVEIVNINAKLITSEGMWTVIEAMEPLK